MSIFRAYDIRGIYPDQLNGELAHKIGMAFGRFLGRGTVALGADVRNSSPDLKRNVLNGLMEAGLDVMDAGTVPTPVLYFTVAYNRLDGGTMITGSHNPKEYNGIKMCGKNGVCLSYETGIMEVERIVNDDVSPRKAKGLTRKMNVEKDYMNFIVKKVNFKKPLRIVIDAGNGVAGKISCQIFRTLGCEVTELHCNPDGNFPNHHPDPLVRENLKDLQARVIETESDLGIAYDGDGDRVGFVDENGKVVENNRVFALLIENILMKRKGAKIVHEVLSSKLVEDVIISKGGVPVISRVGHSYIQRKMVENGCELGGETSGHYYFRESFNYDDGIFASVKLAELLSGSENKISELLEELPKYMTSDDIRVHCPDEIKFDVVKRLTKKFEGIGKIITIDGVKVIMKKSWFIVRASNTQPALVLRWEASEAKEFERTGNFVKTEVAKEIKKLIF
jgi:phosphomannomutase/phosphoglucomutase